MQRSISMVYGGSSGGNSGSGPAHKEVSSGTTWVLSSSYAVTNYHVFEGHSKITLVFPSGSKIEAIVELSDKINDLALIRAKGDLPPALDLSKNPPKVGAEIFKWAIHTPTSWVRIRN